jgi:hypothetical protein
MAEAICQVTSSQSSAASGEISTVQSADFERELSSIAQTLNGEKAPESMDKAASNFESGLEQSNAEDDSSRDMDGDGVPDSLDKNKTKTRSQLGAELHGIGEAKDNSKAKGKKDQLKQAQKTLTGITDAINQHADIQKKPDAEKSSSEDDSKKVNERDAQHKGGQQRGGDPVSAAGVEAMAMNLVMQCSFALTTMIIGVNCSPIFDKMLSFNSGAAVEVY